MSRWYSHFRTRHLNMLKPRLPMVHIRMEDQYEDCKMEYEAAYKMLGPNCAAYGPQLDRCIQNCILQNYPKEKKADLSKWRDHVNSVLNKTGDHILLDDIEIELLGRHIPGACYVVSLF